MKKYHVFATVDFIVSAASEEQAAACAEGQLDTLLRAIKPAPNVSVEAINEEEKDNDVPN